MIFVVFILAFLSVVLILLSLQNGDPFVAIMGLGCGLAAGIVYLYGGNL